MSMTEVMRNAAQSAPLPLQGIRVLEFCDIWIGPQSCSYLADMGAEVWKIETIQRASRTRGPLSPTRMPIYPNQEPGQRSWNRAAYYNLHNRNKYGFTLDVSRSQGH